MCYSFQIWVHIFTTISIQLIEKQFMKSIPQENGSQNRKKMFIIVVWAWLMIDFHFEEEKSIFKSKEISCNCQFHTVMVHHATGDKKKKNNLEINDVAACKRCVFTAVTKITHQESFFCSEGMCSMCYMHKSKTSEILFCLSFDNMVIFCFFFFFFDISYLLCEPYRI